MEDIKKRQRGRGAIIPVRFNNFGGGLAVRPKKYKKRITTQRKVHQKKEKAKIKIAKLYSAARSPIRRKIKKRLKLKSLPNRYEWSLRNRFHGHGKNNRT